MNLLSLYCLYITKYLCITIFVQWYLLDGLSGRHDVNAIEDMKTSKESSYPQEVYDVAQATRFPKTVHVGSRTKMSTAV